MCYYSYTYDSGTASTDTTWQTWTAETGTATGGLYINVNTVWLTWATTATATTSTDSDIVYVNWPGWVQQQEETKAQRDARIQREAAAAEQARIRAEESAAAQKRAEETLLAHLADEQKEQYKKDKTFFVRSRSGKLFKVTRAWAGNIYSYAEEADGKLVAEASYCVHADQAIPYEDNMLAQKLALEIGDEEAFLRVANRTPLRRAA